MNTMNPEIHEVRASGASIIHMKADSFASPANTSKNDSAEGRTASVTTLLQSSMESLDIRFPSRSSGTTSTKLRRPVRTSMGGVKDLLARQASTTKPINENLASLTINKLLFRNVGMVGRDKEKEMLLSSFDRLIMDDSKIDDETNRQPNMKKQIVFLSGSSGVGKSSMVKALHERVSFINHSSAKNADNQILMARGKYDVNEWEEPFAGVVSAFEDLFQQISNLHPRIESQANENDESSVASKIGSTLTDELGPTAEILISLMPSLKHILSTRKNGLSTTEKPGSVDFNFEAAEKQLKYAFRVLARVLCNHCKALILVLDDLQWADVSSLDILGYLLSDMENQNALMIVGCYRSDEVQEKHILKARIDSLEDKQRSQNFEITFVKLEPLSLESTNEVIMRLLSIDDPNKTFELAKLIFKRTLGNPHFLIEFVTLLNDKNLVAFNLGLLQWGWDLNKIEELTMSTDNVAALLRTRMKTLPDAPQLILQYAACLGSSFKTNILNLVWTRHSANNLDKGSNPKVESLLIDLEQGNYLEGIGTDTYRWVHDKVQEAALSLGKASEPSFQFEIGTILYNNLDGQELDDVLFDVVDLINRGNIKRQPDFAALNLRAAEKARQISAFTSASSYVAHGIDLLPSDKWKTHHKMTLHFYTLGTQLAFAKGNLNRMDELRSEVLAQDDCDIMEKVPVQLAHMRRLCLDSEYMEAKDVAIKCLRKLGCRLIIPGRSLLKVQAIILLRKTIRMAKKISPREFSQSQPMDDQRRIAIIDVLSRLGYSAILGGQPFLCVFSLTKAVRYSIRYGLNHLSSVSFASLAVMTKSVFKDFKNATVFADTARLLANRFQDGFQSARALFHVHFFVFSWTLHLSALYKPLLETYKVALRAGNNEYAGWCLWAHELSLSYLLGKPLPGILARAPECLYQIQEMGLGDHEFRVRLYIQAMLKFVGRGTDPTILEGDVFDEKMDDKNIPLRVAVANHLRLDLLLFHGEYEKAARLAIQCGDQYEKASHGAMITMTESFHRCVALYAGYRKTKKRKFKREAVRIRKKIVSWMKKRCPNLSYPVSLLDAEHAAMQKKFKQAEVLYKKAITLAARPGHLHHAGLFNERYADFLMQDDPYFIDTVDDVVFYLKEAIRYYNDWGATQKTAMLQKTIETIRK